MGARQQSLLGGGSPHVDAGFAGIRRIGLDDEAWVDHLPGWVAGHEAFFEELARSTRWRRERRELYDRMVDVPRLIAVLPDDGPGHPLLASMAVALEARYGRPFPHVSFGFYRDGNDSVAWHGDTGARTLPEALVASVSLGEPRRFLLRPVGGGRSVAFALGWGDLLVMGGSCQRTWQHAVPKVGARNAPAGPRLAVMFRPEFLRRRPSVTDGASVPS